MLAGPGDGERVAARRARACRRRPRRGAGRGRRAGDAARLAPVVGHGPAAAEADQVATTRPKVPRPDATLPTSCSSAAASTAGSPRGRGPARPGGPRPPRGGGRPGSCGATASAPRRRGCPPPTPRRPDGGRPATASRRSAGPGERRRHHRRPQRSRLSRTAGPGRRRATGRSSRKRMANEYCRSRSQPGHHWAGSKRSMTADPSSGGIGIRLNVARTTLM